MALLTRLLVVVASALTGIVDASDDIGDCQFPLPQSFYGYKENEPGGHRQEILQHRETGDAENTHQQCGVERPQPV